MIPLVLMTAALAAVVINLVRRTAARTIDGVGWLGRTILAFLLFIGWLVLAPNLPHIPPVNRVVVAVFVVAGLFVPMKVLLGLWLPPARERAAPMKLDAVIPPVYSFSLTLVPLILATGYFAIV